MLGPVPDAKPWTPARGGVVAVATFERLPTSDAWRFVGAVDGFEVASPAAYVRAFDLSVERLEQTYRRRDDLSHASTAEVGAFRALLTYDRSGLVVDRPGVATRFA